MKASRLLLHLCWALPTAALALYVINPAGVPTWDPRGRLLGVIPYRVPADSMAPTIRNGSLVAACTWAYVRSTPERGDVIVFRPPHDPATPYLKRVVGLAGEEVRLEDGKLFIDGVLQEEPYTHPHDSMDEVFSATVPDAHVFVAGDNRSRSYDSRHFGPIPLSDVVGKVCGSL